MPQNFFSFQKMQGAGNDFVVTHDERTFSSEDVRLICDRKLGVGADGFIALSNAENGRVAMDFRNCDGSRADMCGNGLRCAALYASKNLKNGEKNIIFDTASGTLKTEILDGENGIVRIQLPLPADFRECSVGKYKRVFKGTVGVPHAVIPVDDVEAVDVDAEGRAIRFAEEFAPDGANVDFVEKRDGFFAIRTYERGVEGETLACGTGTGAAAFVLAKFFGNAGKLRLLTRSGEFLTVEIIRECNILQEMLLSGPAKISFCGTMPIESEK